LQDSGLLPSNELNTVITDTSKSEYLLSQLKWIISGYEIVNYQYTLQFFHDNAYPKYLKLIPKGFKVTLDLGQLGYSKHYALLINAGIKSDSYQLNDFFTKIHIPKPDIYLNQKLDVKPGFNSIMIPINSTDYFNLNVKVGIDEKDIPENIKVRFPQGNTFNIFDGIGRIPLEVIIDPKSNLTGILLPLRIIYNVIGNNDFITADHNNSITTEYN
jgi:hypothetical protein